MTKTPKNPHGIFCLETIWLNEQRNPSTSSLLELLERLYGIPFAYRDISTWEELDFCLGRWVGRDMYKKDYQLDNLGILYLGFHGGPAQIWLRGDSPQRSKEKGVNLDKIAESLTNDKSRYDASYGAIHFASCSVLRAPARAKEFKEKVRASCVSGYSKFVYSEMSWAFELMYLVLLSDCMASKNVNSRTLGTLHNRLTDEKNYPEYAGLANKLGFKMII